MWTAASRSRNMPAAVRTTTIDKSIRERALGSLFSCLRKQFMMILNRQKTTGGYLQWVFFQIYIVIVKPAKA